MPDIITITEVIQNNLKTVINKAECEFAEYDLFPGNFPGGAKRGILCFIKKEHQAEEVELETNFCESVWFKIKLKGNDKLLCGCIYRSPSSTEDNTSVLNKILDEVCAINYSHILITGDFNFPCIDWKTWRSQSSEDI